jgi:putative heme iron utilization protein
MANTSKNSVLEFLSSRKTLVMATADKNGAPNASYAPFVQRTPWLYVYTSTRSKHTKNMTETTRASVMFIEDETRTRNVFVQERFTCQCRAEVVERESKE